MINININNQIWYLKLWWKMLGKDNLNAFGRSAGMRGKNAGKWGFEWARLSQRGLRQQSGGIKNCLEYFNIDVYRWLNMLIMVGYRWSLVSAIIRAVGQRLLLLGNLAKTKVIMHELWKIIIFQPERKRQDTSRKTQFNNKETMQQHQEQQ